METKENKIDWKDQQKIDKKMKRLCTVPKQGQKWNKLAKYPRNAECFCGSKQKFKKCCINLVAPTVPNGQKQWEELSDAEKQELIQLEKEAQKDG